MLGLAGCDVINPADPIAAYIRIDEVIVDPVAGTGTSRHQFRDVWIYHNTNLLGAYSLPAVIPLITGDTPAELAIFAGIRVNGILSAADHYPFFVPYEITRTLDAGEVTTLEMRSRYRSNVVVPYIEDFESTHSLTDDRDGNASTFVERILTDAYEGGGSGRIILTTAATTIQVASFPLLNTLPVNGTPVFLEMHYRNNVEFSVGLVGHAAGITPASVSILILRPQENWNKVYVNLTEALNVSQLQAYQILIGAVHDATLAQSEIYLDNLKVVHIAQ